MVDIKSKTDLAELATACEHITTAQESTIEEINQHNGDMYREALERYPNDDTIPVEDEKKIIRKLDRRIIPALGVCYFFYVRCSVPQTMYSLLVSPLPDRLD